MCRTGLFKLATTWDEYWQQHQEKSAGWLNPLQAYRLVCEQWLGARAVHDPSLRPAGSDEQIHRAIEAALPELFADYWDTLPLLKS